MTEPLKQPQHIVIFDGVCNFCNRSVNFIIKRDPNNVFLFTPMQSDAARNLLKQYQRDEGDLDTVLLIKNNQCYDRTDALLEITKNLAGFWFMFRIFKILPKAFRDMFYRIFAKNRYRLFGKKESCMVPTTDVKDKFLK